MQQIHAMTLMTGKVLTPFSFSAAPSRLRRSALCALCTHRTHTHTHTQDVSEETYTTLMFALRAMRVQVAAPIAPSVLPPPAADKSVVEQMVEENQRLFLENLDLKVARIIH